MSGRDDDLAVLGPILLFAGALIAIGLYNEATRPSPPPSAEQQHRDAEAYAAEAEADLRRAEEEAARQQE